MLAHDVTYSNANLQLPRLSVAEKKPAAALRYLGRLPKEERNQPAVELLRVQALELSGNHSEADELLALVEKQAGDDPRAALLTCVEALPTGPTIRV